MEIKTDVKLLVVRKESGAGYTLGDLSINVDYQVNKDVRFCFSLEDTVRPIGEPKVHGETAFPAGLYRVGLTHSPKFGRVLPEVFNVPGFENIRIHSGNTAKDSLGCILVAYKRGPGGLIFNDTPRAAEIELVKRLALCHTITLEVRNI